MANETKPVNTEVKAETTAAPVQEVAKEEKAPAQTPVNNVLNKKKEAKVKEPVKEVAPVKATPAPTKSDELVRFQVGDLVTIKETTKTTVVGTVIPVWAYKNIYKVTKILEDRIIIKSENLLFPLTGADLNHALLDK
jgi:hypothetical protein